jgi:hypothetical protein
MNEGKSTAQMVAGLQILSSSFLAYLERYHILWVLLGR